MVRTEEVAFLERLEMTYLFTEEEAGKPLSQKELRWLLM